MHSAQNAPGFILLNESRSPITFNAAALQILAYPTDPVKIHQPLLFVRDKIRFWLLKNNGNPEAGFVREIHSGRRKYVCRAFRCDCQFTNSESPSTLILLERPFHGPNSLPDFVGQFGLTPRELQTVSLLVEGLTSKQIAARMDISPNTVKAFLRIVMFKMDVSTRSGIVGRVIGSMPDTVQGQP